MRRAAAAAAAAVLLVSGCGAADRFAGGLADQLPPMPPESRALPTAVPPPEPTPGATTLSPDGFRTTERVAVRVRNVGCGGVSTGSGFAVAENVLVTNRHVVAGADTLQVSTYDGADVVVEATGSVVLADLAMVRTREALPAASTLAERDPEPGTAVEIVGYPGGGRLSVTRGRVLGYQEDPLHATAGEVMVTDADAEPGSSGSPLYDPAGHVVGVVYAASTDGSTSLAVPVSTLRAQLADPQLGDPPPCARPEPASGTLVR